ncbi:MAG: class I SAM-dependent methyltransferase [Minisyncoccales bacterium]
MEREYAQYLIEKTKKDYNLLAHDYTRTRSFIPEDISQLAKYAAVNEKVLDSGCASGRLFEVLKETDYYGIDFSEKLIEIAQKKYPSGKFRVTDVFNLPFSENFFDKVYSISVLHHLPSKEFQLRYLQEIRRVLKPQGLLFLRVWDFWRRKEGWQLFLKYAFLKLFKRSKLDFFDVFVPWKNSQGKIVTERYFHCFTQRNLLKLIKEAGFKIKKIWRAGRKKRSNLYLIAQK